MPAPDPVAPAASNRCPWAIRYGLTLATRCFYVRDHADAGHLGKGLREFDYQRISWYRGDRREFETDRTDEYSWEVGS